MKSLVKNADAIRLGILGMTEGNGHPYSWNAIFNGYDREAMTLGFQLQAFVDFLRSGEYPFPFSETDELMRLVIDGIESRENGGKVINFKSI